MDVQLALGADIIMAFDECTEYPADRGASFAIPRINPALGQRAANSTSTSMPMPANRCSASSRAVCIRICGASVLSNWWPWTFPGYAIGGLSVGEPRALTREIIESTLPLLAAGKAKIRDGRWLSG